MTVTADDDNGGTATKDVTITLNNLDEGGTVTLSTNQPTSRAQVTATLTDPDGVVPGTTTWQWSKSNTQTGTYDDISSATSATYEPVDGDVGKFLKAKASYDDDGGSGKNAEKSTTSAVQSGTNRAPDFGDTSTTRDVSENTAADQPVGDPVEATDADSDTLTYSLVSGGDAGLFDIDTSTGQIKVKTGTTLDYEGLRKSYIVSVEVTDSKSADGAANTATDDSIAVTINVTDVEEAGVVTLSNSRPPARVEITATLADPDGGVTDTTWQWAKTLDPANNPWTDINGATSASYTPPDIDLTYYLRATASYTDRRGIDKKAEKETTAAVGAGANRPPDFGATTATRSFPENSAANVNVGNPVTATDLDTGNTPEYSLDATGATLFDIDSTSVSDQDDVALDSGHLRCPRHTPLFLGAVSVLHALGVHDTEAGPLFPSIANAGPRQPIFFKTVLQTWNPHPGRAARSIAGNTCSRCANRGSPQAATHRHSAAAFQEVQHPVRKRRTGPQCGAWSGARILTPASAESGRIAPG